MKHPAIGILLGLSVGFFASSMSICGVILAQQYHPADVLFYRMFWTSLLTFPFAVGQLPILLSRGSMALWLRAFFGALGALCFFYTLASGSVVIAGLMASLVPVFVILLSKYFLHEYLSRKQLFAGGVVTAAVLSLNLGDLSHINGHVAVIGFVGAFFSAAALVSLRRASQAYRNVPLILFLMSVVAACLALPFSQEAFAILLHWHHGVLMLLLLFSFLYQWSMTVQFRYLSAPLCVILNQSALIWSVLYDYIMMQKTITLHEALVLVLVLGGVFLVQKKK